jgi:parvulin-like peptidyl-prolyl isomerase
VILKKSLFAAVCGFFLSVNANAVLVDAVSVIVDNEPITIYEIFRLSNQYNIPTKEALDILIRQKLELLQIKQMNIQVDDFTLNQQIEQIAEKNNMSVQNFYKLLLSEGISADIYRSELKQKMQRDKLYQYIISGKYENIGEDQLLVYYNNNPKEFVKFESFDVIKLEGDNAQNLADISYESAAESGQNIKRSDEKIFSAEENPNIVAMLSQTDIGAQTPVMQSKDGFVKYIVTAKNDESIIPFEYAKNSIMAKLISRQENTIIKEYFETIKSRASVTVIRLP